MTKLPEQIKKFLYSLKKEMIKNKVKGLEFWSWDKIKDLKFNNLKNNSVRDVKKLKKSITERGFFSPFYVWKDFVFDGTGRKQAIQELIKEGQNLPDLPVLQVEANNLAEAKIYALQMSSKHGEITQESLYEFTVDIPDVEKLIDEVSFYEFDMEFGNPPEDLGTEFDLPDGDKAPFQQMTFTLADEQANIIKEMLDEAKKEEGYKYCETFGNENSNGNALYYLIRKLYGEG